MTGIKVPVEVYSRVSGYFRPVKQWNRGKKEEFAERSGLIFTLNNTVLIDSSSTGN